MHAILVLAALVGGSWLIDPEASSVSFTLTKKAGREVVTGRFEDFRGEFTYDAAEPRRSSIRWKVRVASVKTGEPPRDSAIQNRNFLDASRFPELTFVSERAHLLPDGRLWLHGTLTIRGRSRPLTVAARATGTDPSRPRWETRFQLDREDFGVASDIITDHAISREIGVHVVAVGKSR